MIVSNINTYSSPTFGDGYLKVISTVERQNKKKTVLLKRTPHLPGKIHIFCVDYTFISYKDFGYKNVLETVWNTTRRKVLVIA